MTLKDPHSYTDLSQGQIQHIGFDIHVDFDKKILNVKADYSLKGSVSGTLSLDTRSLQISRVYSNGKDVVWELLEADEILGQRLDLMELKEIQSFTIECQTDPSSEALQWVSPERTLGGVYPYLYSQCQEIQARSVFPCQDSPAVRITYDASITVPEKLMAVMAAETLGSNVEGPSCTYHFKMTQPIPTYLFALAAGNLAYQELGPRTGVYAEPEQLAAAAYEFAENEDKLEQAEKLLGPYKWDRYDLLILPPTFPYGGMENPRLTFLTPMFIRGNRKFTDIVSHELAHAWTGNLVTNASWEHFWLNEGWTTYAERRISEEIYGLEHISIGDHISRTGLMRWFDDFGVDSQFARLRTRLEGHPPKVTIVPYIKGYTFILMLEQAVGRNKFDAFMQKYIKTFQFQSLTTERFVEFLQVELPSVFDLVDVDEWLYEPGFPDSAPEIKSALVDEVETLNEKYLRGEMPTKEEVKDWIGMQTFIFLQSLPKVITIEDCREIKDLFDLNQETYPMLIKEFYILCIRSGYQDIYPDIEALFSATGRMVVLMPVVRAIVDTDWSRGNARQLYESVKKKHHPLTNQVFEQILREAEL